MRVYSMDLRGRVLKDLDGGMKASAVATKYSVSPAWVRRLKQRRATTGGIAARKQRHGKATAWVAHTEAVRRAPDATLDESRSGSDCRCRVQRWPAP